MHLTHVQHDSFDHLRSVQHAWACQTPQLPRKHASQHRRWTMWVIATGASCCLVQACQKQRGASHTNASNMRKRTRYLSIRYIGEMPTRSPTDRHWTACMPLAISTPTPISVANAHTHSFCTSTRASQPTRRCSPTLDSSLLLMCRYISLTPTPEASAHAPGRLLCGTHPRTPPVPPASSTHCAWTWSFCMRSSQCGRSVPTPCRAPCWSFGMHNSGCSSGVQN